MPSSNPETIPAVIGLIWKLAPKRVLDIGAGYGKYGVLFREYLEMVHTQTDEPRCRGTTLWTNRVTQIDAVEAFADYVGELHRIVYDNVYIENILDFVKRDWEYDVIFMGDVLEHIEKQVAMNELLPTLVSRAKVGVLINVPAQFWQQEAEFGNTLEKHISDWKPGDFRKTSPYVHSGRVGNSLLSFLTRDAEYYKIAQGNIFRRKLRALKRAILNSW